MRGNLSFSRTPTFPMIDPGADSDGSGSGSSDGEEKSRAASRTAITAAHKKLLVGFYNTRKVNLQDLSNEDLYEKGESGSNILQYIISFPGIPKSSNKFKKLHFNEIRPLLDEILKERINLLSLQDDKKKTALHNAIIKRKWQYLKYFLERDGALKQLVLTSECKEPPAGLLTDLIEAHIKRLKKSSTSENSTSTATPKETGGDRLDGFWKCVDLLLSEPMRELAKKPAGDKGNTALHLAVAYCRETAPESQTTLIKKLLDACPELMKELNSASLSPYQYRVRTREEAVSEAKKTEGKAGEANAKAGSTNRAQTRSAASATAEKTALTTNVGSDGKDVATKRKDAKNDQIAFLLKDYYMSHTDREEAAKYLYGTKGKKLAMEFDLSEHSHTGYSFSPKSGKILKKHLKFDNILRYVDLPKMVVERSLPEKDIGNQNEAGTGRNDLEEIFNWLRKDCDVEKIIRVKVEDSKDTSHSDESIENCLKDFGIQVWDWHKIDLCCSTIQRAAPDVREVYLYCSGNNAVLRSWSATNGLASLKKLETIHVRIEQGQESLQRAHEQRENFEMLLKQVPRFKEVHAEVIPRSGNKANTPKPQAQTTQETGEMWVTSMNDFVNFVANLVGDGELNPKPVKVALIDDGVDGSHKIFGGNIKDGISFCVSSDHDKHMYDYWGPSGCHGTQMASLIQKICPTVELYVARLQDGQVGGERWIDPVSAVKAIDWAIEREVDIISMSWTFERTIKNEAILEQDLTEAVKRAATKDILMFCSTGDKGGCKNGQIFPACLDNVFRIGAANSSGKERAETEIDSHYLLPGENLQTEMPSHIKSGVVSPVSGSSLATALASGLAALLLYCIDNRDNKKLRDAARRRSRMVKAFDRIAGGGNGPRYLKVWEHLRPDFKEKCTEESFDGKEELKKVMEGLFR